MDYKKPVRASISVRLPNCHLIPVDIYFMVNFQFVIISGKWNFYANFAVVWSL